MLTISHTSQFKKDYKLAKKRGRRPEEIEKVLDFLVQEEPLPTKYRDHHLTDSRNYKGYRECHITPDWLLIYKVVKSKNTLYLVRTGTHSDLF